MSYTSSSYSSSGTGSYSRSGSYSTGSGSYSSSASRTTSTFVLKAPTPPPPPKEATQSQQSSIHWDNTPRKWPFPYPDRIPSSFTSSSGSRWTHHNIVAKHTNGFIEYYLSKLIEFDNITDNIGSYQYLSKQIRYEIRKEMVSYIGIGVYSLMDFPISTGILEIIYDFTVNLKEQITPDGSSKLLWYIIKEQFEWIPLKRPGFLSRVHINKHTASIYINPHTVIRILPRCLFAQKECMTKHRFSRDRLTRKTAEIKSIESEEAVPRIRSGVHIDWILGGTMLEPDCSTNRKVPDERTVQSTSPINDRDKAMWHRLSKEKPEPPFWEEEVPEPVVTHIMPMKCGLIVRDSDGKFGYLEGGRMSNNISRGFRTEKCMVKTFGHLGCQSKMNRLVMTRYGKCIRARQCLAAHSEYCWNGCCEEHCFETAAPCSFHKNHWRTVNGAAAIRLSLCHRWD